MAPFPAASPLALKVKWYFIVLHTSYLAESGFSCVTHLLSNICIYLTVLNK